MNFRDLVKTVSHQARVWKHGVFKNETIDDQMEIVPKTMPKFT